MSATVGELVLRKREVDRSGRVLEERRWSWRKVLDASAAIAYGPAPGAVQR